jgi:hypothetical protein
MVEELLVLLAGAALLVAGLWSFFNPEAAARYMLDDDDKSTPDESRRSVRVGAVVMILFGLVAIIVYLDGLKPFPPGENGVGF